MQATARRTAEARRRRRPRARDVRAPVTVSGPGPLDRARPGPLSGELELRPDGQGGVETVNAVGLDDYVRGVVAAEMPASWAPQALEAQAVAARTYAITTTVGAADYDLYDDTRSQMYGGVGAETPATDGAVAATSRPDRHLRRHGPRSPTSSPAPAATPRTSRTCGRALLRSRGCVASPTPTTTPAAIPTTAGAHR